MTEQPPHARHSICRICAEPQLDLVLDLGEQPLANAFLPAALLDAEEARYPLRLCRCPRCGHAQLDRTVPPEVLFGDYPYVSGTSETTLAHFAAYAREIAERFLPRRDGFVVEIGSNDGTLLRAFDRGAVRGLGVEPARNIAALANAAGIETLNDFFGETLARSIRAGYGAADAIVANNVVAHIDDLSGLARGIAGLLAPGGVLVAEFPYLVDLLEHVEYDTIYHEHLSYFTVRAAADLFRRAGLTLFDARRVPVHGGSLRVYAGADRRVEPTVEALLRLERERGLAGPAPFEAFAHRVVRQRGALRALLGDLAAKERRIAGYGAAAKASTLLNYCGIDRTVLDYIVDRSPLKQGLYTPGGRIPVRAPEVLLEDRPDAVLLLAWNFADEILRQQARYRESGGTFIIPIPEPRLV